MVALILRVLAFCLFVIAALGVPTARFSLVAAGLACYTLADLVAGH